VDHPDSLKATHDTEWLVGCAISIRCVMQNG
jgi:hypothetical protein